MMNDEPVGIIVSAEVATGRSRKSPGAFRTISEVSDELDVPQHVLRFWETKFPQIRPLKRAGGRRYYRPADVELLRRVSRLLYSEGYTIKGVQRLLKEGGKNADLMPSHPSFSFDDTEDGTTPPEPLSEDDSEAEPPAPTKPSRRKRDVPILAEAQREPAGSMADDSEQIPEAFEPVHDELTERPATVQEPSAPSPSLQVAPQHIDHAQRQLLEDLLASLLELRALLRSK